MFLALNVRPMLSRGISNALVQKVIDSICSIAFKFSRELVNEVSNCNAMVMVSRGDPGDKVRIERKIIELA